GDEQAIEPEGVDHDDVAVRGAVLDEAEGSIQDVDTPDVDFRIGTGDAQRGLQFPAEVRRAVGGDVDRADGDAAGGVAADGQDGAAKQGGIDAGDGHALRP